MNMNIHDDVYHDVKQNFNLDINTLINRLVQAEAQPRHLKYAKARPQNYHRLP